MQWLSNNLQRPASCGRATIDSVNACFVFAGRQSRRFENEAVPIVLSALGLMDIRSKVVRRSLFDKLVVDKKLHVDTVRGVPVVNSPT
jgi:hypothetical protein